MSNDNVKSTTADAVDQVAQQRTDAMAEAGAKGKRWLPVIGNAGPDYEATVPPASGLPER